MRGTCVSAGAEQPLVHGGAEMDHGEAQQLHHHVEEADDGRLVHTRHGSTLGLGGWSLFPPRTPSHQVALVA